MRGSVVVDVCGRTDGLGEAKGTDAISHLVEEEETTVLHIDEETESTQPLMTIASFEKFYPIWIEEEDGLLHSLKKALEAPKNDLEIARVVQACYQHFSEGVDAKMQAAKEDASYIAAGAWKTPFEAGLMWMGGWRPSTAIVLAYSLMGMQVENELRKLLEGISVPSMAALSSKQLSRVNALQRRTSLQEDNISNRLAILQMLVADQQMARATSTDPPPSETDDMSEIKEAMEPKLSGLRDLLVEAEKLRLQTLQELFAVLSPTQAAQYMVAAIEMTYAVRKLGEQVREAQGDQCLWSPGHTGGLNIKEIASCGQVEKLQEALDSGSDPSDSDYDGRTPLHLAAAKGHTECVALLVREGATINVSDNFGTTPLMDALKGGHDAAIQILVNNGAKLHLKEAGTELCKAAASRDMEYVERLVKAGVDPNETDYSKRTPLHVVAADGTAKDVEFLVHKGANVLVKDRHGYTPLDEARENDNEATLKVLEAEVVRRQHELENQDDDLSDDISSSTHMEDLEYSEGGTTLTEGDNRSTC